MRRLTSRIRPRLRRPPARSARRCRASTSGNWAKRACFSIVAGSASAATVGVLAIQGGFEAHVNALERLGRRAIEVRRPEQLDGLGALVIPGGESTTIAMGIA